MRERLKECRHLGYCCGEYFCKLRDDVNDMKPHLEFCRNCKYYEPKEEGEKCQSAEE